MSLFRIEYTVPIKGRITQRNKKNSLPKIVTFHSNRGFVRMLVQKLERANGDNSSRGSNADKVNCIIRIAIVMNPALIADALELIKLVKNPI